MMTHPVRSMDVGPPGTRFPHRLPILVAPTVFVALSLAPLVLVPASSSAQNPISEITVIYGGNSGIQPPAGYTKFGVDLNQGSGGDYIYLCYKRGVGAPITGLAVTLGNAAPPADAIYTRIEVDLNRGAGGDYIWLWYTKDPSCATIRDVHVQADTGSAPAGFTRIDVDLNRNAGGAFIYLSYLKL